MLASPKTAITCPISESHSKFYHFQAKTQNYPFFKPSPKPVKWSFKHVPFNILKLLESSLSAQNPNSSKLHFKISSISSLNTQHLNSKILNQENWFHHSEVFHTTFKGYWHHQTTPVINIAAGPNPHFHHFEFTLEVHFAHNLEGHLALVKLCHHPLNQKGSSSHQISG